MNELNTLRTFDETSLPDLDTVVLGTLAFFEEASLPPLNIPSFNRPLVAGSANASAVGRILFDGTDAVFADESTFEEALGGHADIDGVVVVSASGAKHAVGLVETAVEAGLPTYLLTNTENALAAEALDDEYILVFPKVREPYTYNVSTYMGMLFAAGSEDPGRIRTFIEENVAPYMPEELGDFDAFTLMVPGLFENMKAMFRTKFDELFGPRLVGRVFSFEEAKHAKTVVHSDSECFVSFGEENELFGRVRLHVPLPDGAGYATMMAVGYYLIGRVQATHEPYFKENIVQYTKDASEFFGQRIELVVE